MSYETELREVENQNLLNSTDRPQMPTGFSENAVASIGQIMDENLSISEWIVRESGGWSYDERDQELRDLRKRGAIPDDVWINFTQPQGSSGYPTTNYNSLAKYANEEYGFEVATNEEIDGEMRQALKDRKEYAEGVFARQTGMGAVGEVAGGFVGYGIEPANVIGIVGESLLLSRSAFALSEATTRMGRAIITGKQALAAGVVSETMIQPILFNWHEEIGVDMDWVDALANISSVGVLSGVIGAGSGALIKGAGPEIFTAEDLAKVLRGLSKANKETDEVMEATVTRMREEAESLPSDTPIKEHFEKVDSTQNKINEEKIISEPEEVVHQGIDISDAELEAEIQIMISEGKEPFALFEGNVGEMEFGKLVDYETKVAERTKIIKTCLGE